MSLIEEALRRAQQTTTAPETSDAAASTQTLELDPPPLFSKTDAASSAAGTPSERPFQSWVGLAVVVVATVTLTLWIARPFLGAKSPPAPRSAAAHAPQTEATVPATSAPVATPPAAQAETTAVPPAIAKPSPAVATHNRRNLKPSLILNGVVEGGGEPLAIINGSILQIGETVAGATLLEIKKDTARLRWRDQEIVIRTTR